jgi:hypothetical protein
VTEFASANTGWIKPETINHDNDEIHAQNLNRLTAHFFAKMRVFLISRDKPWPNDYPSLYRPTEDRIKNFPLKTQWNKRLFCPRKTEPNDLVQEKTLERDAALNPERPRFSCIASRALSAV